MVCLTDLSTVLDDGLVFAYPQVDNVDSLCFGAAAIAAQVEHQCRGSPFLQVDKGAAHFSCTALGELIQVDVADIPFQDAVVGQFGQFDGASCNLELHFLARRGAQHFHHKLRAGIAAQTTADVADVAVCHHRVVDAQNDIALLESRFSGRHTLVRLIDDNALQFAVVAYDGTDTGIFTGNHHLQVLRLALRVVFRVRIQRLQHGLDACADDLVGVQRVYVEQVEVLVHLIEDVQVFGHLKMMVLGSTCRLCLCHSCHKQDKECEAVSSHQYLSSLKTWFPTILH